MLHVLPVVLVGLLNVAPLRDAPAADTPVLVQKADRIVKGLTRRYLLPTLETGAPHLFSLGWAVTFATLNQSEFADLPVEKARRVLWDVLYWHPPRYGFWAWNATHPPIWTDHDAYVVNFVVHPVVGANVQMMYRNHGVPWWESVLLVVAWAVFWEYVSEGGYERPSLNDILANGAGAAAGEAMFRAKVLLREQLQPGVGRALLLALLDPVGEFEGLLLDVAEQRLGLGPVVTYLR